MAEASGSSSKPKKSVPPLLSDLLDLAIFSFACQSGLRSHHKIRGDPVVEGVAAFFGRLISCSNPETLVEFDRFSPARLGKWEPQTEPTKELRTLISSRLKIAKSNEAIREWQPSVPSIVHDKKQSFSEAEDRVKTKFFPKCWRCSRRCAFCIAKKKNFPKFGNFNTDIAWPFLDVLEGLLDEEEDVDDSESDSEIQGADNHELGDDDENDKMLQRCLSETSLPESENDDQNPDGDDKDKGDDSNDEVSSDQEMAEDRLYDDQYY